MRYVIFKNTYKVYETGLIKKVKNYKDPAKQVPKRQIRKYDGHEIAIMYIGSKSLNLRVDYVVADSFEDEIEKKDGCNFLIHINGDKLDHNVENLKWVNLKKHLSKTYGSEWKKVPEVDADGEYYISKDGRIWGTSTENLLTVKNTNGNNPVISLGKHRKGYLVKDILQKLFPEGHDLKEVKLVVIKSVKSDPPKYSVKCHLDDNIRITPDGRIYDMEKRKYLAQKQNGRGYMGVNLKKTQVVHRLVAIAYVTPIEGKTFVNHIDRNKMNNDHRNLEWVDRSENMKDIYNKGQKGRKAVKRIDPEDGSIKVFLGVKEAARAHNLNAGSISAACQRGVKAAGYKWEYVEEEVVENSDEECEDVSHPDSDCEEKSD